MLHNILMLKMLNCECLKREKNPHFWMYYALDKHLKADIVIV